MHQRCCFAPINTYICNKADRQGDNACYCNSKLRSRKKKSLASFCNSLPRLFFSFFVGTKWNLTGLVPDGGYLVIVILYISSHLLRVLAFLWMMWVDGWWWEFNEGDGREAMGHFGVQRWCGSALPLYVCVCVCVSVSKGKCRWRCQGWMIAVVFSALWGGSDGCDGWLTVWPPSSGLRLESWAGIDSGGAGLPGGGASLALLHQTFSSL